MKKKGTSILLTLISSFIFGYLFILAWLLGLLASRFVAGKSSGEKGRLNSVIIPFIKWRIHLHHWVSALFLVGISSAFGLYFLSPAVTFGMLAGTMFQGIYFYDDWRIIVLKRRKTDK